MFLQRHLEVARDARHPPRAQSFDPCLFGRVIDGASVGRRGDGGPVQLFIVVTQAQRQGVGLAADDPDFGRRQVAAGQRQFRLLPVQLRRVGAEAQIQIGPARYRPHGRGRRSLPKHRW